MTYYELLHSLSFDEIVPFIEKYHGDNQCTALYKTHFDMLRLLTPRQEEYKFAVVSNAELEYKWEKPHLNAHPMEGDLWEVSLAKELVIEPDVQATPAEIAACCLWHTSFYGFTDEQVRATAEKYEFYAQNLVDIDIVRIKAAQLSQLIKAAGGKVITKKEMLAIPSFHKKINACILHFKIRNPKLKRKTFVRRRIKREYLERVVTVGTFIAFCLPMPPKGIPIDRMCKLFYANHFKSYQYQSYTNDATKRAAWLRELIDQYDAFNTGVLSNAMICVTISPEHPFAPEEEALFRQIAGLCKGKVDTMVKGDERLGREMLLTVAFYE